jgi:uncharacterized protein with NAD-binding domain and iron-sulfur cluster
MPEKVVILGGGVGGLSAAHELAERGFAVEVYERRNIPGGKARSLEVGEPTRGRRPLAGEHGFRFFPGFYKHIVDTMRRIPCGARTVADNLVDTTAIQIAGYGKPSVYVPARFPEAPEELQSAFDFVLSVLGGRLDLNVAELGYLGTKLWQFITSCDERRLTEYEAVCWWDFIGAEHRSAAYKMVFGHGITRSLVAAKARRASTRTIGNIFVQMLLYILQPGTAADRVLNGPTNEVWIEPWLAHLRKLGVAYHMDAEVQGLDLQQGRIAAAIVARRGQLERIEADYFVAALPVERMAELVTPALAAADPALAVLPRLSENVEWMNGIQFYLTEDVPLVHGHTIFLDSPWALTSVSQAQFWRGYDMTAHADGRVKGILSVDISNWGVPGINGKTADQSTREEIKQEVWEQIKLSVNVEGKTVLTDRHLHSWFLDPDILDTDPATPGFETNLEPLLVNYVDTWSIRPDAVTRIPNLFLASDYVRTHTDLATMEAANEAARRATNGILAASRSKAARCGVWPLQEPDLLLPLKAYDVTRFRRRLPWDGALVSAAQQTLGLATLVPPDTYHPDPLSADTQRRERPAARAYR